MTTFNDVSAALRSIEPIKYETEWSGSYLLLVGAAYSIGCAEQVARFAVPPTLTTERWSRIEAAINSAQALKVEDKWGRTYFLTNAVFRVADGARKIVILVKRAKRNAKKKGSAIGTFPLTDRLDSEARDPQDLLRDSYEKYTAGLDPYDALAACKAQWNMFKHEPMVPQPDKADWYWEMASKGFLQTVAMLGEARPLWGSLIARPGT